MSSTTIRHQEEYNHIFHTWLDSNNDVQLLLRGENNTNLRGLRKVMRRPRLEQTTFKDEGGNTKTLSEDLVDELQAIDSFWNFCQNWFGPPSLVGAVDITTTTREDFLSFLGHHGDLINNPIQLDPDLMLKVYKMKTGSSNNNNNNNNNNNRTS